MSDTTNTTAPRTSIEISPLRMRVGITKVTPGEPMVSLAGIAGLISLGVSVGDCNYFITGDELIAAVRAAHEDRVRQEGKAI